MHPLWQGLEQAPQLAQPQGLWPNLAQIWNANTQQPAAQQQVISPTDNLSPEDQMRAKQQMLQNRNATTIRNIDPGPFWRFDRNTISPDDAMSDSFYRHLRQDNI